MATNYHRLHRTRGHPLQWPVDARQRDIDHTVIGHASRAGNDTAFGHDVSSGTHRRIASVDALRGLVVLLLIPDVYGGFSFYEMSRRHPDDPVWGALAAQFTHVPWQGLSLWDMVMPAFVLLVGVSMALSIDRRLRDGVPRGELVAHALLRSLMLIVLGLLIQMPRDTVGRELLPYVVLACALPWSRWLERWTGRQSEARDRVVGLLAPALVVCTLLGWLASDPTRLGNYDFTQILTQMGLAYLPALALMGRGVRMPLIAALSVLAAYGIAFVAYTPAADLPVRGEVLTGLASHWNNGNNLAVAVDQWLFATLPRGHPYIDDAHGYHTIEFIPLVAVMLIGVAAGRLAMEPTPRIWSVAQLAIGALAIGLVLMLLNTPLVKSLWTPSWTLVSAGLVLVALCSSMALFDAPGRAWLAYPLTVLGANALLLYVVTNVHRWRVVLLAQRLLGDALTESAYRPLLESLCALAVFWAAAALLDRWRVHLRL